MFPAFHMSGKSMMYQAAKHAAAGDPEQFSAQQFWDDIGVSGRRRGAPGGDGAVPDAGPRASRGRRQPAGMGRTRPLPPGRGVQAPLRLRVSTAYGMTESGCRSCRTASTRYTVARPAAFRLPGYEVQVVDEHDQPLPERPGELIVRTPSPGAERRLLRHAGGDGRGVAQRLVPHRRRLRRRRGRQLLLRRPHQGRDAPSRREHLVLRGRGARERAPGRASSSPRSRFRRSTREDEVKVCVVRGEGSTLTEAQLIEFLVAADAELHGPAATSSSSMRSRRPTPHARAQVRAARRTRSTIGHGPRAAGITIE